MNKTIDFCFDLISPASYLAYTQLELLAQDTDAEIVWRPVLVGAIHKATGNTAPITVPAKAKYLADDLMRCADVFGVDFAMNPHFPFSSLQLQRMATGLLRDDPEGFKFFLATVFESIWVFGADLSDPEALATIVEAAGFEPEKLIALAEEQEVKDLLRDNTQWAIDRGAFGVPTFFVGPEMYWGQDRIEMVREALRVNRR